MKKFYVFIFLVIIMSCADTLYAQKSVTLRDAFTLGLSYHGTQFYEEDQVVNENLLEDGMFSDGLLGFNLQYILRNNKLLGIAVDYRFLVGIFDRGFRDYQQFDFTHGHQIFVGPAFNIGKGFFNVTLRPQIGFDYLKIAGEGDWETSSSGGFINFTYIGSNPMVGMWGKMLSDYSSDTPTTIIEGYPAYIRKGFLYQIGTNFNLSWEKTTLTLMIDWSSMKYNDINHEEFGVGLGAMFHF
ncbi:MAG TPA: hypothetical protein PLR52_06665 [Bacteroidales bacterium]|nr:hypothetical protein [Bacteroidales bacterium]HPI68257.1 hypothetical protein [Bacteroidales bacterium]HPR73336.1 hypothetical protein [Bacteroidales bacterium]